eukprot:1365871-Amorphochlora_amoeboformis.AAC.1
MEPPLRRPSHSGGSSGHSFRGKSWKTSGIDRRGTIHPPVGSGRKRVGKESLRIPWDTSTTTRELTKLVDHDEIWSIRDSQNGRSICCKGCRDSLTS